MFKSDRTSENEPALSDIHSYTSLVAPICQEIGKGLQGGQILCKEDAVISVEKTVRNVGGGAVQTHDQLVDVDVEEIRRERRALQDTSRA